jgi:hypothetical protein
LTSPLILIAYCVLTLFGVIGSTSLYLTSFPGTIGLNSLSRRDVTSREY